MSIKKRREDEKYFIFPQYDRMPTTWNQYCQKGKYNYSLPEVLQTVIKQT